jgi:hypothetical protein
MKYAVEMSSGVMICVFSFIKIGSGIGDTDRQQGDRISLLSFFFKIRKVCEKYMA